MTNTLDISDEIKQRIETTIPNAKVEVTNGENGHFALTVISELFADLSTVKQHQLVYSAFTELMSGPTPPVHAIDKMDLRTS